jgi:hypothetical protein
MRLSRASSQKAFDNLLKNHSTKIISLRDIRMYEAQLNSRMYEARLRQHSLRDSLIFFPILKWSRDI